MMTATHCSRFYFNEDRFAQTPSRQMGGLTGAADINTRTSIARHIHSVGKSIGATNLTINTAITLMNRFYLYHEFTIFQAEDTVPAALALACKIDEDAGPLRKLKPITLQRQELGGPDTEQVMLQTFGFDTFVWHPHVTVVLACDQMQTGQRFKQQAYANANWSLLVTAWCVQHRPELVACAVLHVTCQQLGVSLRTSGGASPWYVQIAASATIEQLDRMRLEYIVAYEEWTVQASVYSYL